MTVVGLLIAGMFVLGAVRSALVWMARERLLDIRRPGRRTMFAAFVTARVGMWLSVAGVWVAATMGAGSWDAWSGLDSWTGSGSPWGLLMITLVLAAIQGVLAYFLGRQLPREDESRTWQSRIQN